MHPRLLVALPALLCLGAGSPRAAAADRTLLSWGDDSYGQVSGTPSGTFSAIAAGGFHSVAIRTDGSLVSWGADGIGQVSATPLGTFSAVAAGESHSVAIREDGTVVSWGEDFDGQVRDTPSGTFSAVAAGTFHSVAIRTDGILASWGYNAYGQVAGTPNGTFSSVAAGFSHNVAIRTDGTLVSWGDDSYGQMSDTPAGTFCAVAAGGYHSVALRTDGALVAWGFNCCGQVGHTPGGTYSAVAANLNRSAALRTDGLLFSWGVDAFFQEQDAPAGALSAVAVGYSHGVAVESNSTPVARCRDVTVSAGADCLTVVSIDNASYDPDHGNILTLTQSPAGPYPVGRTIVTLTVTDNHGASNQCTATVTVVDNTPPELGPCPAGRTVNATSPAGAAVAYATPPASDNCSQTGASCLPASGGTFPIGTTTVICTAMDGAGNTATCSFIVEVKGPAEQLSDLIASVQSLSIPAGTKMALNAELQSALRAINANHRGVACTRLQGFIRLVNSQPGNKLTRAQASQLLEAATRIRAVLGC